ncbi:MAG: 8-oxoguanine DNA glycosylase, N-terminal domain-containing protein, partial [Clostridiales Family XIII bacterium]|nr:8-oxoguanine DNA glycosylase, N-terminal domain-containing protein [Clostridiales Family XIII bacterium]
MMRNGTGKWREVGSSVIGGGGASAVGAGSASATGGGGASAIGAEQNRSGCLIKTVFTEVTDFDPEDIFECGQCFRWRRQPDGSYSGIVEGSFANVSYCPDEKRYNIGTVKIWSNLFASDKARREKYWRNYLDLNRDYTKIKRILSTEDTVMARAIRAGGGIRLL